MAIMEIIGYYPGFNIGLSLWPLPRKIKSYVHQSKLCSVGEFAFTPSEMFPSNKGLLLGDHSA
jgi:hypothetical protein